MSNPAPWIALGAIILSCYFSACSSALRIFSKMKLDDLLESLDADKIDRAISVRVVRGGQLHEVSVTLSSRPPSGS